MLYPISLRIEGRLCLIVGGGSVALQKARALRRAGAQLRIVGPKVLPGLKRLRDAEIFGRPFQNADIRGAVLVIAATDDERLNARISRLCGARRVLVNVVDRPELCTFTSPSTLIRGPLVVAVSTDGVAPGLSKTLRRELERIFPAELGRLVRLIGRYRRRLKARHPDSSKRLRAARRISSPEVLSLWRRGGLRAVERALRRELGE